MSCDQLWDQRAVHSALVPAETILRAPIVLSLIQTVKQTTYHCAPQIKIILRYCDTCESVIKVDLIQCNVKR